MKNIFTIVIVIICQLSFSQLKQEDIGKFEIEEGTLQLDVLKQKLENNKFVTSKHKRFIVDVFQFAIENQKVFDTINNTVDISRKISYVRNENNFLTEMIFKDFNNTFLQKIEYQYDFENNLLSEILYDENKDETQKITYNYDKCKASYLFDLLDDSNHENPEESFHCITKTTLKKISNYTISIVEIFKIGTGKVKKIDLKGDEDSEISRFYTYRHDENGNVTQINLHRNNKIKVYKTNKYNLQGDLIHTKLGYSELFYTYKYDASNNWIEKIETSKIKSKRVVYKRTVKK